MKNLTIPALTIGILAASITTAAPAVADSAKIGICHATGNGKYVPASVDKNATAGGHADHQDGADIIPAYSWVEGKTRYYFDGQNLDNAGLLGTGCKTPAAPLTANPAAPVYVPASCSSPDLPYGRVIVPGEIGLGTGVGSASRAGLSADNTTWTVTYSVAADTEDAIYSWPAGFDGTYTFAAVPITADPLYVTDSKTGVGQCELSNTGAGAWMVPATLAGAGLIGAGFLLTRRRTES